MEINVRASLQAERLGRTSGTKRSHSHTLPSAGFGALNGGQVHRKDGRLKTESAAVAFSRFHRELCQAFGKYWALLPVLWIFGGKVVKTSDHVITPSLRGGVAVEQP